MKRIAYISINLEKGNIEDNEVLRTKLQEAYIQLTKHPGDAGLDLFCLLNTFVSSEYTTLVDLGFSMVIAEVDINQQPYPLCTPIAYMLLPRSSTHKKGIIQMNGVGIVDAGYRGNLMVASRNCDGGVVEISGFDRLFQA